MATDKQVLYQFFVLYYILLIKYILKRCKIYLLY